MGTKTLVISAMLFSFYLNAQTKFESLADREEIMELLQKYKVPAMGLGIIENGKLIAVNAYGEIKKDVTAPYNTIFDVASLTKSVVTMTTLQLVENGDWNLDKPLYSYWVDPDIINDSLHKKLTTRHVLTHTSGFNNWRWMDATGKLQFHFEPGKKFKYSGEGFEYLRKALESKFKISLQRLSDSLLFRPLGMKDSRHAWDENVDESRFAIGHDTLKNSYELPKENKPNGADNVLTTIEDFGIFGINVFEKLNTTKGAHQEMVKPQVMVREKIAMGLGWFIFPDLPNDEYALYNAGGDPGVHTVIVLLPKSQKGLIIFTNGDNGYLLYKELLPKLVEVGAEIISRI